ncbi:hypothetical protein ACEPAH_1237 [Sanghuangporus vaninii]
MAHGIEETGSGSSYTPTSSCTETEDEVRSASVPDNAEAQATEAGLGDLRTLSQAVCEHAYCSKAGQRHRGSIFLPGIDKHTFRNLLRLLYPPPMTSSFTGSVLLDRELWIKVLDLAQTWDFAGIRALAIQKLESADFGEVEKLELALKYQIEQWCAGAYFTLAKRSQPLSIDEGRRLGLELSLKMAGVRERNLAYMKDKFSGAGTPENKLGLSAPSADSSKLFRITEDAILAPSPVPQKDGLKPTTGSKPAAQTSQTPPHADISLGTSDTVKPIHFMLPLFPNLAKPCAVIKSPANDDDIRLMRDIKKTFGL